MTPDSFAIELAAVVETPSREGFERLHTHLSDIEYTVLVDRSPWTPSVPPDTRLRGLFHCTAPGCHVTWRTPDACLLRVGDEWRCRQHHPLRTRTDEDGIVTQSGPMPGFVPAYSAPLVKGKPIA